MLAIFYAFPEEIGKEPLDGHRIKKRFFPTNSPECIIREEFDGSKNILSITTGRGKDNAQKAAECVLSNFWPDMALIVGTCGALKKAYHRGDIIVCNKIHAENKNTIFSNGELCSVALKILEARKCDYFVGKSITVPEEVEAEKKKTLAEKYPDAIVVDRENYWISRVLFDQSIPFIAVRVVDDTISNPESDYKEVGLTLRRQFLLPFIKEIKFGNFKKRQKED